MMKRILLIEDETATRLAIKKSLIGNGFHVEDRANTKDALHYIDKGGLFDAAILDINLPDNNKGGIEIAERISDKYPHLRKPIIFLTNFYNYKNEVLKKNLGDNFFEKQKFIDNDYQEVIDYIRFPLGRGTAELRTDLLKIYSDKDHYLPFQSIIYIKSDAKDYVTIETVATHYRAISKRLYKIVQDEIIPYSPNQNLFNIDFSYRRRPGLLINVEKIASFTTDTFTFIKNNQAVTVKEKGVGKMIKEFYEMKKANINNEI